MNDELNHKKMIKKKKQSGSTNLKSNTYKKESKMIKVKKNIELYYIELHNIIIVNYNNVYKIAFKSNDEEKRNLID